MSVKPIISKTAALSAAMAACIATVAGAPLAASAQSAVQSAALSLQTHHSERLSLRAPIASVVVANPEIADVSVVDTRTLFIIGKAPGVTEIAAVDSIGRTLMRRQVRVSAPSEGAVRLWRGNPQGLERGVERVEADCLNSGCAPLPGL